MFTTHTPVPAGIDRFEISQIQHFFEAGLAPDVPVAKILDLGREDFADGNPFVFNMAVMGLRLAQRANGVAKLHGVVSRGMFSALWPGFDHSEVPITSVTNGVHVPTWVDPRVAQLAREQFGAEAEAQGRWDLAYNVTDEDVWALRREMRVSLVEDVRRRLRAAWKKRGAADAELAWTDSVLDPDILTIGFARRVPTYKRLTLMLRDPERLKALLLHKTHPIQLVIAGKSHPADDAGKKMIQDLVRFTDDPAVRHRIAFLPNYDIAMARTLFPGCDVWLNNPLRPLEACGTSGMKAALNGSLNLSVLDGWWDEMYDGENGWAIPTANNDASPEERDDIEAAALYELLEKQVAPRFYGLTVSDAAGAAGPSAARPAGGPHALGLDDQAHHVPPGPGGFRGTDAPGLRQRPVPARRDRRTPRRGGQLRPGQGPGGVDLPGPGRMAAASRWSTSTRWGSPRTRRSATCCRSMRTWRCVSSHRTTSMSRWPTAGPRTPTSWRTSRSRS